MKLIQFLCMHGMILQDHFNAFTNPLFWMLKLHFCYENLGALVQLVVALLERKRCGNRDQGVKHQREINQEFS